MHARRPSIFWYAKMYSGNSVRLNKTKIRWKGIYLEVCVVFNLSQISLTLQLCGRCMLCNHANAIGDHSLPDYVINLVVDNY